MNICQIGGCRNSEFLLVDGIYNAGSLLKVLPATILTFRSGYFQVQQVLPSLREDLPSHLNLYNPMNISQCGGHTFIPTFHDTNVRQIRSPNNDNLRAL